MSKPTTNKFSAEVRDRAVRLVLITRRSIRRSGRPSTRLRGCTAETLRS